MWTPGTRARTGAPSRNTPPPHPPAGPLWWLAVGQRAPTHTPARDEPHTQHRTRPVSTSCCLGRNPLHAHRGQQQRLGILFTQSATAARAFRSSATGVCAASSRPGERGRHKNNVRALYDSPASALGPYRRVIASGGGGAAKTKGRLTNPPRVRLDHRLPGTRQSADTNNQRPPTNKDNEATNQQSP